MDMITVLLIVLGFYILVYVVAQAIGFEKLSEKGIEANFPLFLMWKTERLNAFLTRLGKKFPRAFFNIGVVVGYGGLFFAFWLFGDNLLKFFIQPEAAGGVVPIIPGVTVTGLPLVYMLIALAVTLLTHEFAHGLAASRDDIPIKSSGLLSFYILFGAFVEPDEEAFENQASPRSRLRMFAAGSYSNLVWGLIFFVILANFNPLMSIGFNGPNGAYIYDIGADTPAAEALQIGDVIVGLNDTTIETWGAVSVFMTDTESGQVLTIHAIRNSENITQVIILGENDANATKGYIGIFGADYWEPKPFFEILTPMYAFHMQQILFWCFLILVSVGLFNLLPIPPLDGDSMLKIGLGMITSDETKIKYVMWPARIAAFTIVILSIVLSFITGKGLF
ncbi:MAG: site-2 protease family protein [Candidatus Thorarchaeota archaeon]|jgi:membrane-associated protease RseP (regulator of RpoE activity)